MRNPLPLHRFVSKLKRWAGFLSRRERLPAYLALLSGMISVRGLPPIQEELTMMVGFALFFVLLNNVSMRRGAWLGFLFGWGHFSLGFWWLLTSIHLHGGFPLPLAVLALLLFSAAIALYSALFGALLPRLVPRPENLPLAAPALWVVMEWLRSHLFTGFAWNLVGYGWNGREAILQIADLGGVYLLSWLMLFPAAILALIWQRRQQNRIIVGGVLTILFTLGCANLYGSLRIDYDLNKARTSQWASPLKVALVQGNIPQEKKWDPGYRDEGFKKYINLSREIPQAVDLVIWPETAVAFFLQASPDEMGQIKQLSQHLGAPILTGAPMADKDQDGYWNFYNSALLLDEKKNQNHRYNKHHLVPFGEYIPLRQYLPDSVTKLTAGASDFTPGPGPIPVAWSQGNIGLLICYEVIFPDEVRQLASSGVRWLVNITNDAWFGESAKPQHLAMARLRAIENRLPMVRVANTGISAAFDQGGHELARIPANQAGTVIVELPRGRGQSLFKKSGQAWIWFWSYLSIAIWLSGLFKRDLFQRKKSTQPD
ncbi:MAG: apolipoprotein N-acyltransferase [Magnetococcales bacterium]|nr:apolipoprotein N-acyltransferase [Magnetococcales bacterium]